MLFKKKEEKSELTQKQAERLYGRAEVLMMAIRQLYTDLYFGYISREEFDAQKAEIDDEYISLIEIAKGKRTEENQKVFDNLMGNPIPWLDEIFGNETYDGKVHKEIEQIYDDRKKQSKT